VRWSRELVATRRARPTQQAFQMRGGQTKSRSPARGSTSLRHTVNSGSAGRIRSAHPKRRERAIERESAHFAARRVFRHRHAEKSHAISARWYAIASDGGCHASVTQSAETAARAGKRGENEGESVCAELSQPAETARLATPLARFGKSVRGASKQRVVCQFKLSHFGGSSPRPRANPWSEPLL
jgi:hypothetical protein